MLGSHFEDRGTARTASRVPAHSGKGRSRLLRLLRHLRDSAFQAAGGGRNDRSGANRWHRRTCRGGGLGSCPASRLSEEPLPGETIKSFVQISTPAPGLPQADLPHPLAEWATKAAWRLEAALPWSSCCSAQSLPCQCSHVHRVRSTWSTIAFYTSSFQIWVDNEGALVGLDPHSEGGGRVAQICAKTKWRPQLLVMTIRLCWHLEKSQRLYLVPENWWRLNWLW